MSDARVYLILGGTGGIGSAVARRLVERGQTVIVGARDEARLARCAEELGVDARRVDATRFDEVERCASDVASQHGRLDGVANCVGSILLKPAHMTSEEEWAETVALNLTSAFATVRAAARPLMKQGGSIVLVSTAAARLGFPNHEAIAATKAGVIGLTLSAAATYAPKGVRVNCVAPGLTRTPLAEKITSNEPALRASTAMHALGRIGEPRDVAAAIEWLLDPAQSWVTGQVLGVDGGLGTIRSRS